MKKLAAILLGVTMVFGLVACGNEEADDNASVDAGQFEIRTVDSYPESYDETVEIAQEELNTGVRPELAENLESLDGYDVIFQGYPNWWGDMPMAVYTFLESHDFSGKTIIPFCTHAGSGLGSTEGGF